MMRPLLLGSPLVMPLLHRAGGIQHCDVRAIHFVPAERVEINAKRFDVDVAVRSEGDAIDAEECTGTSLVSQRGECTDVVDAAEDIGGVSAGYEPGCGGEKGPQVAWCQKEKVMVGGGRSGRGRQGILHGRPPFDADVRIMFC